MKEFQDLNEALSEEELHKIIIETMHMADRPRTWNEYFSYLWESFFN